MIMVQSACRRKGQYRQPKRVQVHDEEGWTHITTTQRTTSNKLCLPPIKDLLVPAEPPDGLTFKKLKKQFQWHKRCWEESQSWQAIKAALDNGLLAGAASRIDNCVCVGLGSPSGFLRGGWVDRRAVSLYQLAALVTMLEYFANENILLTSVKDCSAQDPVFNTLDKQLLESTGIRVVEHPAAFTLINDRTFLYSPGAERVHLLDMLASNPTLFFGGPLDDGTLVGLPDDNKGVLSGFLDTRRSMSLPPFDPNINAFWKSSLFWRPGDT
ncbi:SRR1 superfamily domain-containing protein [Histoplasma capsulatum var. duboisii H88]|uniref:SRR1 superfamily domain-containing protein n=2 Tax=Ajellomyces capsulatus (strain H88) TaxID=544711 RepID=A0A8A1LG71_AJEC8|nr:SRR1 superfamily domain-containing protein [Histoplasma capsulatum var. duboisii H88]